MNMAKETKKDAGPVAKPGDMVIALIEGKERGPLYFAQVAEGKAHLQGESRHVVDVADIVRKL